MTHPRFFGFGSLVHCGTHDYPNTRPATLNGWRREWVCSAARADIAYLSAKPAPGHSIEGLTADVPKGDWAALDAREEGYTRSILTPDDLGDSDETWIYAVPKSTQMPRRSHVILQSYLDVVLQGFYRQSGEAGLHAFFATTDGWDTPVLNDRANKRYPRHQSLSAGERALFDALLAEKHDALWADKTGVTGA